MWRRVFSTPVVHSMAVRQGFRHPGVCVPVRDFCTPKESPLTSETNPDGDGEGQATQEPHIPSAKQSFKDLLRLARFLGGKGPKGEHLVRAVRFEFRSKMNETDPEKIKGYRLQAAHAIANYILLSGEGRMKASKKYF